MVKVEDFWNVLCFDLNYRFYAGVPISEFKLLHSAMNPDLMHYIPTISESIAVGLASGAFLSGYKGVVMMSSKGFDFLIEHNKLFSNIPLLYIVEDEYNPFGIKQVKLTNSLSSIKKLDKLMNAKDNQPGILVVKKDTFV